MEWLLALLARVALLVTWVATPLVGRAFHGGLGGWLLPLLGLVFLPFTTLAYILAYTVGNGVVGWAWLWVVLGLAFDLITHSHAANANRHRLQHGAPASR